MAIIRTTFLKKQQWKTTFSRSFSEKFEIKRNLRLGLAYLKALENSQAENLPNLFSKFVFSNSAHVCPPEQQRAGGGLFLLVAWQVRALCLNFLKPPACCSPSWLSQKQSLYISIWAPNLFSALCVQAGGPLLTPWWVGRVPSIPRTLFNTSPCIFHPFYCWL